MPDDVVPPTTVTCAIAERPSQVAVTSAAPAAIAVSCPLELTSTIVESDDAHVQRVVGKRSEIVLEILVRS